MTTESTSSNTSDGGEPAPADALVQQLTPLLSDLLYPSESDEPVEPIQTTLPHDQPLTIDQIRTWLHLSPDQPVSEKAEADFWQIVLTEEDWYGDDEKARTARFQQLHDVLQKTLTDHHVFRVGETEIDVYLLGKPTEGFYSGIKTRVVET